MGLFGVTVNTRTTPPYPTRRQWSFILARQVGQPVGQQVVQKAEERARRPCGRTVPVPRGELEFCHQTKRRDAEELVCC